MRFQYAGTIRRNAILAVLLAVFCALIPAPTDAGIKIKLYKAKESAPMFKSSDQKIQVWEFTPANAEGPLPGVVMLYGLDCLDELPKSEMLYKNVAGMVADAGFIVHFVHYFNCTPFSAQECKDLKDCLLKSVPNYKDKDKAFDPLVEKPFRAWTMAAKEGVEFLRQNKNVDKNRIGVVGLSMGGFVGTSAVVEYPELKVSALANIFGGLPPQHMDKVRKEKMKLPPMLIMGAEDDDIVPEFMQRDLFLLLRETGNRGEAHFYGDVGHAFVRDKKAASIDLNMAMNEAVPVVTRFLKRHLQTAAVEKK